MMEEVDSAGRRDEHGNAVGDEDKVVATGASSGRWRENKRILPRELVVVRTGCSQFRIMGRPGVGKGC
jgi:hypothetical protein